MKARLVRIGNSRGVRIPKLVIEQAGLAEDVELQVRGNTVVISSRQTTRAGWAEAARRMHEAGHDRLLDRASATKFDEEAWRWR